MRVLSVILTVALVLFSAFPAYATSTGSALTYNDQWLYEASGILPIEKAAEEVNDLRAAAADPPDGSSSNPFYVRPTGTSSTWYYYDYDDTMQSSNHSYTNFNSMFAMLSQMIANDFLNLAGYFDDVWLHGDDWNLPQALDYIIQGLFTGENDTIPVADVVNDIWSEVVDLTTIAGNMSIDTSNISSKSNNINSNLNSLLSAFISFKDFDSPNTTYNLLRYRQVANGGTTSDLTPTLGLRDTIHTLFYILNTLNTSSVYAFRDMLSGVSVNSTQSFKDYNLQDVSLGRQSMWADIRLIGTNMATALSRLSYVLASDDEIAARAQAANNQAAIVSDFVDPNGGGSISVSDIGDMADLSNEMKDTFSSNVDPLIIFDGVGSNSHAWDWFSNDVKNSLAYNPSRGSDQLRSAPAADSATPYLDAYYRDVQEALGVNLW